MTEAMIVMTASLVLLLLLMIVAMTVAIVKNVAMNAVIAMMRTAEVRDMRPPVETTETGTAPPAAAEAAADTIVNDMTALLTVTALGPANPLLLLDMGSRLPVQRLASLTEALNALRAEMTMARHNKVCYSLNGPILIHPFLFFSFS